jgi:hypothetical protein
MMKPDTPKFALVPQSALDWLDGSAPDADGKWFGECEPENIGKYPKKYWWRSHFRKLISAAPKPDCVGVEEIKAKCEDALWQEINDQCSPRNMIEITIEYLAAQNLLTVKNNSDIPPSDLSKREGDTAP